MPTRYFRKEIPDTPLRLSNGVPLRFDFLETDNEGLLRDLDAAIRRSVGGVVEITSAEYIVGLEKKSSQTPRPPREIGASTDPTLFRGAASAAGSKGGATASAVAAKPTAPPPQPAPLSVPKFSPRIAKQTAESA